MYTLKKLNARGFAHHLLFVFIVLAMAIGGTAYLVATHADSNTLTASQITADYNTCMRNERSPIKQRACASTRDKQEAQLQAQQKATASKSTSSASTSKSTAPAVASTSKTSASSAAAPKPCNYWGSSSYMTGAVDSTGQAVVVTCTPPKTTDPCGYSGGKAVLCTPATTHPSATTCNYGGVYPNCIRILNNTTFKCPANSDGTSLCDLSSAKPVSPDTQLPAGCHTELNEGQEFPVCPEGTTFKSASATDYDITQQYNACVAAAGSKSGTAYATAVGICTATNTYQECALKATTTAAKTACTSTYRTTLQGLVAASTPSTPSKDSKTSSKTTTDSSSTKSSSTSNESSSGSTSSGKGSSTTAPKKNDTKKKSTASKVVTKVKRIVEFWNW